MQEFTNGGFTFYVLDNPKLEQGWVNNIQKFVPGWFPKPIQGYLTVCVQDGNGKVGVYEVENVLNLFAIVPKCLHEPAHLNGHIIGIIQYIHHYIQQTVALVAANDVRFKITFYAPTELDNVPYNEWEGDWKYVKATQTTNCGNALPAQYREYGVRLSFDNNYNIKKTLTNWLSGSKNLFNSNSMLWNK